MNARSRAGGTVEPDQDAQASNGEHGSPNGDGSNGDAEGRASQKRRSTVTSGLPKPERGTSSQRGASSSSVARKPPAPSAEPDRSAPALPPLTAGSANGAHAMAAAAVLSTAAERSIFEPPVEEAAATEPPAEPRADHAERPTGAVLEPPAPIALPAAPTADPVSPDAVPFDDAAMSEPFGIPMVETPEEQEDDVQPLPLPIITTPPAARGSQAAPWTDPTWAPAAVPDVPFEPPYVTSTTMTSHHVAPVPRLVGRRPRVRKVTRVVRHVDPWSVFKIALIFNLVLYGVLLTAGVLLWNVAYATGTIDNLERFFESFGWSSFEFNGGAIYHAAWIAGLFGVIGLTGAAVLAATLFNLITDLVGGVRMTVLEEEVVEKTTAPMRRFTVRRTGAADPEAAAAAAAAGPDESAVQTETLPVPVDVPEPPTAPPDDPLVR